MHEYAFVEALLEAAARQADAVHATAVRKLVVRVGDLAGLDAVLFRRAFETFRERTLCAGAEMDLVCEAPRWECRRCSAELSSPLPCPCGGNAFLAGGGEVLLQRIEMEVP